MQEMEKQFPLEKNMEMQLTTKLNEAAWAPSRVTDAVVELEGGMMLQSGATP